MKKRCFLALAFLTAAIFTACEDYMEDPRDQSYEIITPEQFRVMATVVSGGSMAEVTGAGNAGIFAAGKDAVLTGYSIAKNETTWELWKEVYDWALLHGYTIVNAGVEGHGEQNGTGGDDWPSSGKKTRPVTKITWRDAVVWCNAYSELSGLEPVYYTADGAGVLRSSAAETELPFWNREKNGFRLPQETEWEYAARGGSTDDAAWDYTYSGGNAPADVAWFAESAAIEGEPSYGAHPVEKKAGNRLRIYDMSGNAAEWCWDSYSESILEGGEPSGEDSQRVVRGGSWRSDAAGYAVKHRSFLDPLDLNNTAGFRVARTLPDNGDEGDPVEADETIEPLPEFTGLPGTKWLWGQSLLEFTDSTVILRGDANQPYTYTVTSMAQGQQGSGTISIDGGRDFIVNEDRSVLEIVDYRKGGVAIDNRGIHEEKVYNAIFMRRDPAVLTPEYLEELSVSTLMGTEWNIPVGGGTDGTRFKGSQWLIFFTKTIAVNRSANYTNIDEYTFNKTKMRGWIYFINDFIMRGWDEIYIPSYKQYGHDMRCYRVR